jgi:hypothetical protein
MHHASPKNLQDGDSAEVILNINGEFVVGVTMDRAFTETTVSTVCSDWAETKAHLAYVSTIVSLALVMEPPASAFISDNLMN